MVFMAHAVEYMYFGHMLRSGSVRSVGLYIVQLSEKENHDQ